MKFPTQANPPSLALHAGWNQGVELLSPHGKTPEIKRIVLLTDGQANVGETNPTVIANHVEKARAQGLSTSTYGVGSQFNEMLLERMARAGGGNFF